MPSPLAATATEKDYRRIHQTLSSWAKHTILFSQVYYEAKTTGVWKLHHDTWKDFVESCGFTEEWARQLYKTGQRIVELKALLDDKTAVQLVAPGTPETLAKVENLAPATRKILDGIPTAKQVDILARAKSGKPKDIEAAKTEVKEAAAKIEEKPIIQLDKLGTPIPEKILLDWRTAEELGKKVWSMLGEVKAMVGDLDCPPNKREPASRELSNTTMSDIEALRFSLKQMIPHAVCDVCRGLNTKNCTRCYGRGFLSKYLFETCSPGKKK
jgi:hypothetical protein